MIFKYIYIISCPAQQSIHFVLQPFILRLQFLYLLLMFSILPFQQTFLTLSVVPDVLLQFLYLLFQLFLILLMSTNILFHSIFVTFLLHYFPHSKSDTAFIQFLETFHLSLEFIPDFDQQESSLLAVDRYLSDQFIEAFVVHHLSLWT